MENREKYWIEEKAEKIIDSFPVRIKQFFYEKSLTRLEHPVTSYYGFGEARTGKTISVCWRILEWSRNQFINRLSTDFILTSSYHLLEEIRDTQNNPELKALIVKKYKKARLLVIDDLGAEKMTDWAFMCLYDIIDHRYSDLMTTFYTSNFSLQELSEKIGDNRITSRIAHDCKGNIVHFDETPFV